MKLSIWHLFLSKTVNSTIYSLTFCLLCNFTYMRIVTENLSVPLWVWDQFRNRFFSQWYRHFLKNYCDITLWSTAGSNIHKRIKLVCNFLVNILHAKNIYQPENPYVRCSKILQLNYEHFHSLAVSWQFAWCH